LELLPLTSRGTSEATRPNRLSLDCWIPRLPPSLHRPHVAAIQGLQVLHRLHRSRTRLPLPHSTIRAVGRCTTVEAIAPPLLCLPAIAVAGPGYHVAISNRHAPRGGRGSTRGQSASQATHSASCAPPVAPPPPIRLPLSTTTASTNRHIQRGDEGRGSRQGIMAFRAALTRFTRHAAFTIQLPPSAIAVPTSRRNRGGDG
jgi:hypothetical protein